MKKIIIIMGLAIVLPMATSAIAMKKNDMNRDEAQITKQIKAVQEAISNITRKEPNVANNNADKLVAILKTLDTYEEKISGKTITPGEFEDIKLRLELRENEIKFMHNTNRFYSKLIASIAATSSLIYFATGKVPLIWIKKFITHIGPFINVTTESPVSFHECVTLFILTSFIVWFIYHINHQMKHGIS